MWRGVPSVVSSFRCLLVAVLALAAIEPTEAEEVFSPGQKTAIEAIVHDYYLNHPDAFIEAIQKAQSVARASGGPSAQAAIAKRRNDLFADLRTPVVGNTAGDVTVVEFFDYRCPYCKRGHPNILALIKDDPGVPVLGPDSAFAARAAVAASLQGGYQRLHDALLEATVPLTNDAVMALADAAGLNKERLARDMSSLEVDGALARNAELANALGIHGTPSYVVEDTLVPGAIEPAAMRKLIAARREAMRAQPQPTAASEAMKN
jgi:protein-disulfide isomerase